MKIRIEGCTAEELAEYSPYLSFGKLYEAEDKGNGYVHLQDDWGEGLSCSFDITAHLPEGAKWIEVTE